MAIFDFNDYNKDDDENKTPSQKASQKIKQDTQKKTAEKTVFDFTDYGKHMVGVPKDLPETKTVETKKTTTQKVGDFLKSGAQTVGNVISSVNSPAKASTTFGNLFNTTKQVSGNVYTYAKNAIADEWAKEQNNLAEYKAKNGIAPDAHLSYDEIRDFGTPQMLNLQKEDKQKQLADLEAKPNKTKLDTVRINNYKEAIKQIDEVNALSPKERVKKEAFILGEGLERVSANVFGAWMGVGSSSLSAISWLSNKKNQLLNGDTEEPTFISTYSEEGAKRLNKWSELVTPSNQTTGDQIIQGFASTAPFYVSGLGLNSLAQTVTNFSPKIAALIGITGSAFLEAGTEAGQTYQENLEQGKSREEADNKADNVFAGNVAFNIVSDKFGIFNDAKGVKGAIIGALGEGSQEAYQQALQNINTDKPIDQGVSDSFAISLLTGGVLGSATQMASEDTSLSKEDRAKLKEISTQIEQGNIPETSPEVKEQIQKAIDTSVDEDMSQNDQITDTSVLNDVIDNNTKTDTFSYTPATNLSKESAKVESTFGKYLSENLDTAEKTYTEKFGNVLNTDNARELSDEYNKNKSLLSPAVHEPASAFVQQLYKKKLSENPTKGQMNTVLFTAGGTGAGKTTAINTKPEFQNTAGQAQIVYDTNLSSFDSSKQKIDQALEAGKTVKIIYVSRDPLDAMMNGAVPRALRMGRTVPLDVHMDTHIKSLETIQKLVKEYKDNRGVKITILDNSHGKGGAVQVPIDSLKNIAYDKKELTNNARKQIENLHKEGKISDQIYEGFIGRKAEGVRSVERETGSTSTPKSEQSDKVTSKKVSTPESRDKGADKPVTTPKGEIRESRAYKNARERIEQEYQADVNYRSLNIAEETGKAIAFYEKFPEQAIRIAKGIEKPPSGYTDTAISIAAAEKAREAGDFKLQNQLETARSLRQTRRGQEIVMERGRMNENSAHHYVAQVLKARLEGLVRANQLVFALSSKAKDIRGNVKSKASQAVAIIDQKASSLKKRIDKEAMNKLQSAQDILNNLTCKI